MTSKGVHDELKEAYREQNKAYNQWKKKLVGTVPEVLHSPELLNSDLIHCLVKAVDQLLAQRERDEGRMMELEARIANLEVVEEERNLGGG